VHASRVKSAHGFALSAPRFAPLKNLHYTLWCCFNWNSRPHLAGGSLIRESLAINLRHRSNRSAKAGALSAAADRNLIKRNGLFSLSHFSAPNGRINGPIAFFIKYIAILSVGNKGYGEIERNNSYEVTL
jgi:hypothetical protein